MLLWSNVKAGFKIHTSFNQKAIKSIVLHDDILILNYVTKKGNEEDFCFNDIADADLFLYNTLSGYRSGQFSVNLLKNFLKNTSTRLKGYIPTESTGFGRLIYLNYGRFIITQEVETISALSRSIPPKKTPEQL